MKPTRGLWGVLAVGISAVACTESGRVAVDPFILSDSAGIEISLNRPAEDGLPTIYLNDAAIRLGSELEGDAEFFGQVNSLHFDPNGHLWVADIMNSELRVFSIPSGEHLFTVGGRGDGPGEFRMPVPLGFDERNAWVWDRQLGRLTELTLDGELVGVQGVVTPRGIVPQLLNRTRRGAFIGQIPETFTGPTRDGMIIRDTVRIWEFDGFEDEPYLLVEREGVTWLYADQVQAPVPFANGSRFEAKGDRVVLSDPGGAPVLDVFVEGRLQRRIEVERPREAVTADLIEQELEGPTLTGQAAEVLRRRLRELPVPQVLPTWEWIRISPRGEVFALRRGTLLAGERWDMFDASGRLAAVISLADGAHLMEVGEHFFAVLEVPDLSGPQVAIHPRGGS